MASRQLVLSNSKSSPQSFPTERSPPPRRTHKTGPRKLTTKPSKHKLDEKDSLASAKAPKVRKLSEPDRKILVAVDFGTTFSGFSWAQTRKPDVQTRITQWPDATSEGLEGVSSEKVPTEIMYDGQDFKWGFQIEDSVSRQQWFKIDLDPSQLRTTVLSSTYPDPRKASPTDSKDAVQTTTDYLRAMRKHAEQVLRNQLPPEALSSTSIEYIVTIPAVWSDKAQAKTRACAEEAGMGEGDALHVVSEPEAAAIYALDAMNPHDIQVNDTFVLCDAGGGTVDLISYTVLALKPKLKVVEASPGNGHLCGSSFLNRIFQRFIEKKLGHLDEWDKEVLEEAMKRFESTIKRQFRGIDGKGFTVPVPGIPDNPDLAVLKGKFGMTGEEIKSIFKPVIDEVLKLVKNQIKATKGPIKAVLLVGGFGSSAYLRDRIREAVGKIIVMQSPNGWSAVVRGALMKGLASNSPAFANVNVAGRSARKHFGMIVETKFVAETHEIGRRYWHNYKGCHMILHMNWFVKKGDIIKEEKPCRLKYQYLSPLSKGPPSSITAEIHEYPDRNNSGPPQYKTDNNGVVKLATIKADLNRIPTKVLTTKSGADGEVWYVIDYEIRVTYFSAYTKYELYYKRTNYGTVIAEYV